MLDAAVTCHRAGISVVPARADGSKAPAGRWKRYQQERPTETTLREWFTSGRYDGFGAVTGRVSGQLEMLEFEGRAKHLVDELGELMVECGSGDLWERIRTGYVIESPRGGPHFHYRVDGPAEKNTKLARRPSTAEEFAAHLEEEREKAQDEADPATRIARLAEIERLTPEKVPQVLIETRGEGGFTILAPSGGRTHPNGKPWVVTAGSPDTIPTITLGKRDHLFAVASHFDDMPQPSQRGQDRAGGDDGAQGSHPGDDFNRRASWEEILERHGWTRGERMDRGYGWRRPGKDAGISATTGQNEADNLYVFTTSTAFETERPYSKFAAYALLNHDGDFSGAAHAIRTAGFGEGQPGAVRAGGVDFEDADAVHHGQTRMAYRLAVAYKDKLMHVHGLGWFVWDESRWVQDDRGAAVQAVFDVLRLALADSLTDHELRKDVKLCESAAGNAGVLKLAAALPEFAVTVNGLDQDPHLLNCANGTLDLRTGKLRPHDPADRITKITRAAYDPTARHPVWDAFLASSLPDADVRGFLQRYVGLGLAGVVIEHVLAILTGVGRNGKGVFYLAVANALGDYAISAEPELFMHREGAHPTGEMDLRGVRWVVVSESDRGRKLAEATVKRLTGGDKIRARRMRQDFVEFTPSHTACLVTNHLPQVRGDDPALWARLRVVPFDIVIATEDQDKGLGVKLELEADGVLTWAVQGWVAYQARGLDEPIAVESATAAYQQASDPVARFISERCIVEEGQRVTVSDLYTEFCEWVKTAGRELMTKNDFGQAMDKAGFTAKRGGRGVWFRHGLRLDEDYG